MDTIKIRNKFTEMSKIFKDVIDEYESLKSENEKLKHQIEKHKEAYSLMCSEKTRRYDELMVEKRKLEAKEQYDALDAKNSHKI
tara:strand:+ start:101 stop:352 length:252 start_codon:yes stop_codon:yes gene_type:complete